MNKLDILDDKVVFIGVCGVSTAYKSASLVEKLRNLGAEVRVILNEEAEKFVSPLTFERTSGHRVTGSSPSNEENKVEGDTGSPEGDITVVAPASFSFIGKLASGLNNDYLTQFVSSSNQPVIIAPSMNENLYSSQMAQSQLSQLRDQGYHTVAPKPWGPKDRGSGDLPLTILPEGIIEKIREVFHEDQLLQGQKVLVTSGPTRETFGQTENSKIGSPGSLGFKLSKQARLMGAEVLLASGPTEQIPPPGVGVVWVRTVDELDEFLTNEGAKYDLILMADSAHAWSTGVNAYPLGGEKTKRFDLELNEVPDLTRKLGRLKPEGQVVIDFAPDTDTDRSEKLNRLRENDIDGVFSYLLKGGQNSKPTILTGSFLFNQGNDQEIQARNRTRLTRKVLREIGERYFQ